MGRPNVMLPVGFLIASLVCAIIGGALYGYGVVTFNNACNQLAYDSGYNVVTCVATGATAAEIYAGMAFLALFGVLNLVFWILLIVFFVQRNRAVREERANMAYNPGMAVPSGKGPVHQVNPV